MKLSSIPSAGQLKVKEAAALVGVGGNVEPVSLWYQGKSNAEVCGSLLLQKNFQSSAETTWMFFHISRVNLGL